MCLLVVAEPNSTPKRKDLENGACNNPHGFGYAIVAGNKIISGKGMSSKKVISEFLEMRKKYPDGYATYHARFATHGVKNEDNCHPFVVGDDKDTVLAHNGILDVTIAPNDKRSDTRVFAEDVLPAMGGVTVLDNAHVWGVLSKWASGNKIAVLTTNPNTKYSCYIINEGLGSWDNDGIWWSNDSYKPYDTLYPSFIGRAIEYGGGSDIKDYTCVMCEAIPEVDANPYYCEFCLTCYDCSGIYEDSCQCWSPEWDRYAKHGVKQEGNYGYYNQHFDF